jgi:hypothetical protein
MINPPPDAVFSISNATQIKAASNIIWQEEWDTQRFVWSWYIGLFASQYEYPCYCQNIKINTANTT